MKKILCFWLSLHVSFAWADYICDSEHLETFDNKSIMVQYFTVNKYNCDKGFFLPANAIQCKPCPNNYICNGGSFDFNEYKSQGIELTTYFTQNTNYTCSTNFLDSLNSNSFVIPLRTPNIINLTWNDRGQETHTTCTYDTPITDIPANPTRPGYKFMGWRVKTDN